ncbi:unnamed protein product [Allacma fusca]|uniref:PH domain-containing protein n=1 Tax=Allacma fusca TaxID=39272 RepID=A0A8J2JWU8_9HEXA|nr:unnamed protein product [Allacma fusca]
MTLINAEKLINLQNRLPNTIVLRTNRFLIKESELLKVCRKELQPRYFALMTDYLLCMTYNASIGAPNMKDLKLRYELPLTGMRISTPSEDYLNEFSVISNTRNFNLVAKSAREKDDCRVCDECYEYLLEEFDEENSERDTAKMNSELGLRNWAIGTHRNHKQRRFIPDPGEQHRLKLWDTCNGERRSKSLGREIGLH